FAESRLPNQGPSLDPMKRDENTVAEENSVGIRFCQMDGLGPGTQMTCSSSALWGPPMEDASMCDYSLSHLQSRPATVSDRLVVTRFSSSCTQGFTALGDNANVVVCLRPGTELVFDKPLQVSRILFGTRSTGSTLARFRQVELDNPHTHHDALEFCD